jgi:hypothetical protein
MGLFDLVTDIIKLPIDAALDLTGVTPIVRTVTDSNHDQPFGTLDRLTKIVKDLED